MLFCKVKALHKAQACSQRCRTHDFSLCEPVWVLLRLWMPLRLWVVLALQMTLAMWSMLCVVRDAHVDGDTADDIHVHIFVYVVVTLEKTLFRLKSQKDIRDER